MDDDEYNDARAQRLKREKAHNSPERIGTMAVLEVKAICVGHAVDIGHGTGESATQTMARAKDLYCQMEAWMIDTKGRK